MDPNANPGSANPANPRTPSTPFNQPGTPGGGHIGPSTPASVPTPFPADFQYLHPLSAGTPSQQLDVSQASPAPATPLQNPASNVPQRSPASTIFPESSRLAPNIASAHPLLNQLVGGGSSSNEAWQDGKSNQSSNDGMDINVDMQKVDVLSLIKMGEDFLAEILVRLTDVLNTGRILVYPADNRKELIQYFNARNNALFEAIDKGFPSLFRRLRLVYDAVNKVQGTELSFDVDRLLPVCDASSETPVSDFEEEMRSSVKPELWKQYCELKEKLVKRDRYLKEIIDVERGPGLQEVPAGPKD